MTTDPRTTLAISSRAIGVAVMRCQAAKMTEGWKHLIETMAERHEDIIIFLGDHGGVPNEHDPLTVPARSAMIRQAFPYLNLTIKPLRDHPYSHQLWSRNLDDAIAYMVPDQRGVVFYAGRDSGFDKHYGGRHRQNVVIIDEIPGSSGTATREATECPATEDAQMALVHYQYTRPGFGYSTVDVVIFDPEYDRFLLVGKNVFDGLLAFCGGHWSKGDLLMEDAGDRERGEEILGIQTTPAQQLYTLPIIGEPRYRDSQKDGCVSTICVSRYLGGEPMANPKEDADFVAWVPRTDLLNRLVPWHVPIGGVTLSRWPDVCRLLEI